MKVVRCTKCVICNEALMPNDISYALKLILPVHHARMSNVP